MLNTTRIYHGLVDNRYSLVGSSIFEKKKYNIHKFISDFINTIRL